MEKLTDRRLLLGALATWFAIALVGAVLGGPLGHDEAAFAISARGGGTSWLYRSPGVITFAEIGIALGGAEWQLRLPFALLSLIVPIAAFLVGRVVFSARVGAWAAVVLATAHPMVMRAAEVLGDVPATGGVLLGIAVLARELPRDDGPRWSIVLAAPALAFAFYMRYGSGPVIALVALVAAALWPRALVRRPGRVLVTAAAFVVLLVPHALHSLEATGSLLGVLEFAAGMPRRAYVGEGLVMYLTTNPLNYYGVLVTPILVAGLVALVRPPGPRRPVLFLGIAGVGQLVLIGLQSHAQPRYVFIAVALLVVLGTARILPHVSTRLALVVVTLAGVGAAVYVTARSLRIRDGRAPLIAVTSAIRADAAGAPCTVTARATPQLEWYTGCVGIKLVQLDWLTPWTASPRSYVVSLRKFRVVLDEVLAVQPGNPRVVATEGGAQAWHVTPK